MTIDRAIELVGKIKGYVSNADHFDALCTIIHEIERLQNESLSTPSIPTGEMASEEEIEEIIHRMTFWHNGKSPHLDYKKDCHYCNDREWLTSIAHALLGKIPAQVTKNEGEDRPHCGEWFKGVCIACGKSKKNEGDRRKVVLPKAKSQHQNTAGRVIGHTRYSEGYNKALADVMKLNGITMESALQSKTQESDERERKG